MVAGHLLALHNSLGWPWLRQMVLPSKVLLIGAESPLCYNPPSATSGFPLQPGCDVLNEHHGWELFSVSFHPWPWLFIFHWCLIYLSVYEATRLAWSDSDRHLIDQPYDREYVGSYPSKEMGRASLTHSGVSGKASRMKWHPSCARKGWWVEGRKGKWAWQRERRV